MRLATAGFFLLAAGAALARAAERAPPPFTDIASIRCVINYIPDAKQNYSLARWEGDLDRIKAAGFNAVWVVNVWAEFEPSVESPDWNEERIAWLRDVCEAARKRRLRVCLALAYVGEGWEPKGIDGRTWLLRPAEFARYLQYLRRIVRETRQFRSVFYLIMSEELLSTTLLVHPQDCPEAVGSFRAWAQKTDRNAAHWNARWATDFTWASLRPLDATERKRLEAWQDAARWHSHILRSRLPEIAAVIRGERPDAVVGYHDFLLDPVLALDTANAHLPAHSQFNFYSFPFYYDASRSMDENVRALLQKIAEARGLYPRMPLWVGELGADSGKCGEQTQADWFEQALPVLRQARAGYSVWAWREHSATGEQLALLREDGSPRTALAVLKQLNMGE